MREDSDITLDNNMFNEAIDKCVALQMLRTIINNLYARNQELTSRFMTLTINPLNEDVLLLMRELISKLYLF